mmetsp:Transcript_16428/g.16546  ORF Transcript_16428/g.16546 Transcript_16428/m.16546 type:complete len:153 (+) Transcript_16428:142-600(+)|eukprot:CAMPEP_0182422468 /NCGR_PEP_ID=MMETSP1167-20130531/8190_1 /TAXON_ID=2988 /ORGANISM="Mallomonas Sp, Strain CCMP3275" /LENGTH=152 /DNA_ID=CAMNT_0024600579 /DNA_START=126 /DNA_END=584 /DNA_ORIENTATION=-
MLSKVMRARVVCHRFQIPGLISFSTSPSAALDNGVIVTKSCAKRIKSLKASSNDKNLMLRVGVEGGGCSGFQYIFSMENNNVSEDDIVFRRDDAEVVVDSASLELIKGATIDYQQELIRSAFAIVNNPNSESACGCGSSFAVKAFSSNPALD